MATEAPAKAELVKLRYFAGLSIDDAAELLIKHFQRHEAVDDKGAPELREMEALGLVPGASVRVAACHPDGRMSVEIGDPFQSCEVDAALAQLIFVTPVA